MENENKGLLTLKEEQEAKELFSIINAPEKKKYFKWLEVFRRHVDCYMDDTLNNSVRFAHCKIAEEVSEVMRSLYQSCVILS